VTTPEDPAPRSRAGLSGLVVMVPEADPVVGEWRTAYDPVAAEGVPAHVSVLYPFLNAALIGRQAIDDLGELLGAHRAFDVRFTKTARWPGVLYLEPEPDGPLRELTASVAARWPEVPPYGGRFEPVPHLTVGQGQEPAVYDAVEAALSARLPISTRVTRVLLVVHDGRRWHERAAFPLARG
jgi:2'-5' RNA ligase